MAREVGHIALGLNYEQTKASFEGLKGIVEGVVAEIQPIVLKINTNETLKQFDALKKSIENTAIDIKVGGVTGSGNTAASKAYAELSALQRKIAEYSAEAAKAFQNGNQNTFNNAIAHLKEYRSEYDKLLESNKKTLSSAQLDSLNKAFGLLNESIDKINAKGSDKAISEAAKAAAEVEQQAARIGPAWERSQEQASAKIHETNTELQNQIEIITGIQREAVDWSKLADQFSANTYADKYNAEANKAYEDWSKTQPVIEATNTALQEQINLLTGVSGLSGKSAAESAKFFIEQEKAAEQAAAKMATITQQLDDGKIGAQIDGIVQKFSALDAPSDALKRNIEEIKAAFATLNDKNASQEDRIAAYERLNQLISATSSQLSAESSAQRAAAAATAEAVRAERERENSLKSLYNMLSQINALESRVTPGTQAANDLANLKQQLLGLISAGGASKEQLQGFSTELARIKSEAPGAASGVGTMANGLAALESRMLRIVSLSSLVMAAVRELKQMVTTAIDIDSAMTQLKIVTDNSEAEYKAYGDTVAKTAQQIGASMKDIIDSTTTFARLGYSLSESMEMSRLTSMLKNVGDIDVTSAQNAITAITKAFDIGGDQLETAMDKLVTVGNNFPISVAELAEGMNNAGSALAAAGNSYEQSVALLAAANTTVQNISKSSTALRTITARIRNTKTELNELGEVVNQAKYQEVIDILTGHGVSLTDANGYRATYDILRDIAAIWDELDDKSQASITQNLAGTRGLNVFSSIINQFNEAEKAMEAMGNSEGALQSANDEFMESMQAHINSFHAAFENLSRTAIDSGLVNGIIDAGTHILNGLTKIIAALEKVGGILPVINGFVTFLVARIGKKALDVSGITSIVKALTDIPLALKAAGGAHLAAGGGGGIVQAIFGALGPAGTVAAIVAVSTALVSLFAHISKYAGFKGATKRVEEETAKLSELEEKLESNKQKIEELNAIKESSNSWTVAQELEINNLETQNALLEAQIELQRQLKEQAEEKQREEAKKGARDLTDESNPGVRTMDDVLQDYLKASEKIENAERERALLDPDKDSAKYAKYSREIEKYARAQKSYGDSLVDMLSEAEGYLDVLDPTEDTEEIEALNNAIDHVNTSLGTTARKAGDAEDAISQLAKYSEGGNVDLTNRVPITTTALRNANWKIPEDDYATLFSSTYSSEDGKLALNFTPIITDPKTGKPIGVMTPDALGQYASGVINGVHDDYLKLQIGSEFKGDDAIKQASDAAQDYHLLSEQMTQDLEVMSSDALAIVDAAPKTLAESTRDALRNMLSSEDFSKHRDSLEEFSKSLNGITAKNIEDLAGKSSELADILRIDGVNAEFLADVLQSEFTGGMGIDLITDKALLLNDVIGRIRDRINGATADLQAYSEATGYEHGDAAKKYVSAYKQFQEDWKSGKTGSEHVEAAIKLILPDEALADLGYDLQAAGELLSSSLYQAIFTPEGDPGYNFAKYVKDSANEALKGIVEIKQNGDSFDIFISSVEELANALNIDVDAAQAFLDAMDAFGVQIMMTGKEVEELATDLGLVDSTADNITKVKNAIADLAATPGIDGTEIRGLLDALESAGYIDLSGFTDAELGAVIKDVVDGIEEVDDASAEPEITVNNEEALANINAVIDLMASVEDKEADLVVNHQDHYYKYDHGTIAAEATGTISAPGGKTLVNELGPELISENGQAYIANGGKPAIVNLSKGAIVLNAEDTKHALRSGGVSGRINAMAGGSPSAATFPNYYPGGGGGGSSSKSSSSRSDKSSSSDTKKEESWFEKQYKLHKHYLEMDQELQEDFLEWLDSAYKKAYAEGVIDLDEFYKHQEEVYKGQEDLFKDHLNDIEHMISLSERAGDSTQSILNMYQRLLNEVNAALEAAFARGLDENDDYVQELQNKWYDYYDKLKKAREDAVKDATSAADDLVKYRIKMLKQYIKNEVDSLNERLKNLKDFHQKQKEMLRDVADEEDYIEEQAEKRKKVTDIETQLSILNLDDSAWAQKRKAQLKEELADAQKELQKFERDHAIEVAQDQLDSAYEIQERAINARIDQLNDLADNPKALYDQALEDVRNNSVELYEEMIAFNNKYGDGIQKTVVDMWEKAYVSLKNYTDLYHEFYEGINLINATGYQPGKDEIGIGGNFVARNPGGTGVKVHGEIPDAPSDTGANALTDVDPAIAAHLEAVQNAIQAQLESLMTNFQSATANLANQISSNAQSLFSGLSNNNMFGGIDMGDIIINGSASNETVSEIRRAQRDNIDTMLKELNKLRW